MNTKLVPDIFAYHDYRLFLREWILYRKTEQDGFTLKSLSQKAGIAQGYLSSFFAGTIGLSNQGLNKILPWLGLGLAQRSYLKLLRTIAESEAQEERVAALKKLQRFQKYKAKNRSEVEAYRYLTRWYYVAIREMALMDQMVWSAPWIQGRLKFKVSLKEIEETMAFLVESGHIKLHGNGKVEVLKSKQIDCEGGVYKIALSKFHHEMLGLAQESIHQIDRSERGIIAHTFAIPKARFSEIHQALIDTIEKIKSLEASSLDPDSVCHVELAGFLVADSKAAKSGGKKS